MVYHKEAEFHNDLTTSSTACDDYQFLSLLSIHIFIYTHVCTVHCKKKREETYVFPSRAENNRPSSKCIYVLVSIYIVHYSM